jgi:hypothetical protein
MVRNTSYDGANPTKDTALRSHRLLSPFRYVDFAIAEPPDRHLISRIRPPLALRLTLLPE